MNLLGVTDLNTYIIGVIAVILLPGPNSMFCLTVAAQYGARSAYQVIAAILISDSILMAASVLGAASAMRAMPSLFVAIQLIGGLYLAFIGVQLFQAACKKGLSRPLDANKPLIRLKSPKVFKRALLLSLLNPKAILFFLSFFIQFIDVNYPHPAHSFLLLAGILQLVSFIYLNILTISGVGLVSWFRHQHRLSVFATAFVGLLFIGFALRLFVNTFI